MKTLRESALSKVLAGITSIEKAVTSTQIDEMEN